MLVQISNIPVSLDALLPGNEGRLSAEVSSACGCDVRLCDGEGPLSEGEFRVVRRSVDARRKANIHFVVTAVAEVAAIESLSPAKGVSVKEYRPPAPLSAPDLGALAADSAFSRPIVVGAGPAGLFCALYLAMAGLDPLVVERGKPVDQRMRDVDAFFDGGELDPDSNVQFGEGGAGTFSDGKLGTGTKDARIRHVLEAFVQAGAPCDILVDAKPHIGTDLLPGVIENLRKRIEALGGTFAFGTRFEGVEPCGRGVLARFSDVATDGAFSEETDALVLAIGHSARDTFHALRESGLAMERKPFAVGARIEHLQSDVDAAQYGYAAGHPALGSADYKLAVHGPDGRGVYTFCMCPGGTVVAAASERGGVCVNGMSDNARSGVNANSALLVEVRPDDLPGDDVLEGVRLQRDMEEAAYELGSSNGEGSYVAPAQTVGSFLLGEPSRPSAKVVPSYPRGVTWCDLRACLPAFVSEAMADALPALGRKLHGFDDPEAVMTGVEARSSSPVRMLRGGESMQSVSLPGVFPAGEGAGYAGGITSAAVDGLRVAEAVCAQYARTMQPASDADGGDAA